MIEQNKMYSKESKEIRQDATIDTLTHHLREERKMKTKMQTKMQNGIKKITQKGRAMVQKGISFSCAKGALGFLTIGKLMLMHTTTVCAAGGVIKTGVGELDTLINTILLLLASYVSVIGIIKLINGVKVWSDANEEMDAARKSQGMNTMVSGGICACVLPILAVLGYAI